MISGSALEKAPSTKLQPPPLPSPFPVSEFVTSVQNFVAAGWKVTCDGPTGVMIEGPKRMKLPDQVGLAVGFLTCWIYGIGVLFITAAILHYCLFTKPATKFLPRV